MMKLNVGHDADFHYWGHTFSPFGLLPIAAQNLKSGYQKYYAANSWGCLQNLGTHVKITLKTIVAPLLILAAGAVNAQSFNCITGSPGSGANAVGCTTQGVSVLSWSFVGNKLTISNNDANPGSFITGISFDYLKPGMDVALAASQMAGVSYVMTTSNDANIPNSFNWTIDEGAIDEGAKKNANAIQGGEQIVFDLTGVSMANIGNTFKFGVHLQGMDGDRSEKLVAVTPVPEPETYAMMLAGLGLMGAIVRRRKNKAA